MKSDSAWSLLAGIIDRPGETLGRVAQSPRWRWVPPAILALLAVAVSGIVLAPLMAVESQKLIAEQMAQLPAEQAAQVQAQIAGMQTPLFVGATAILTGVLGLIVGWLISATIIYFGSLLAGGGIQFPTVLALAPWLSLPSALESLLQTLFISVQGKLIANPGLSALVSTGQAVKDARNLAYVALSQVTLFRLWHLVLVYVLFRAVCRFGRNTSVWLTAAYALLTVGGSMALAALASAFGPAS